MGRLVAHRAPHRIASPVSETGGQTILLVEDDDAVRRAAGRILAEHGYVVHEAASVEEARDSLAKHGTSIDLLLTDMVLGGNSGAGDRRGPRTSGTRSAPLVHLRLRERRGARRQVFQRGPHLHKPFTPTDLVKAVRKVLTLAN